ncbi:uncharacterized protein WCC33_010129 [Rhinophrynus dorsalis]
MAEGSLQSRDDGEFDLDLFFFGADPPAVQSDIVSMLEQGVEQCAGSLQVSAQGASTASGTSDTHSLNSSQDGLEASHLMASGIHLMNSDLSSSYPREAAWSMCPSSNLQGPVTSSSTEKVIQPERSPSDITSIITHLWSLATETSNSCARPEDNCTDKPDLCTDGEANTPETLDSERQTQDITDASSLGDGPENRLDLQGTQASDAAEAQFSFACVDYIFKGKSYAKSYICSVCGKSCPCRSAYIRHERIHTGDKPYACTHCGKSFVQSSDYNNHMRSHTGEKPYSCAECGKSFSRSTYLVTHFRTHTKEKPYTCNVCGKSFIQHSHLALHLRIHSGEKPYICIECGNSFSRSSTLVKHKISHRRKTLHLCKKKKEGAPSISTQNMEPTRGASSNGTEQENTSPTPEIPVVKCENEGTPVCSRRTGKSQKRYKGKKKIPLKQKQITLEKYIVYERRKVLWKKNSKCVGSREENLSSGDTQTSGQSMGNDPEETGSLKREDVNSCAKSENNVSEKMENLNSETQQIFPEQEHKSSEDRLMTSSESDNANIKMTKAEEADPPGPFQGANSTEYGDTYNRVFVGNDSTAGVSGWTLPEPYSSPRKESSYVCSYCGKSCPCKSAFLRHQKIHTGEKPFSCHVCGKSFIQISDYTNHMRSHTGEKPFSCPYCGKCFSRSTYLVTHSRIHTKEKPYTCTECGKSFVQHSHLSLHLRIHSGEKPYTCGACGKKFSRSSTLVKHQKSHNKKNITVDCAAKREIAPPGSLTSPSPPGNSVEGESNKS